MAHNIGKMFYVGERPWHGLGTALTAPVNLAKALEEGGLDFTVSMLPLMVADEPSSAVPQRMAVVRDDRAAGQAGRVLGVVHPNFKPLQNREGAAMFDQLFGKGGDVYHLGGYLKQGEIVWLQAKLPEPIVIADDDKLDAYLLFSNSHDGSYPIDIRIATVRVVCNNTLNLALRDKDKLTGRIFRRGHSQSVEIVKDDAAKFFETVMASQIAAQADLKSLAELECQEEAFIKFLQQVLPVPAIPASALRSSAVAQAHATKSAKVVAARAAVMSVHLNGYIDPLVPTVKQAAAPSTWWGALNSITAWVDHIQAVNGDRYAHQIFGGGSDIKARALDVAISKIPSASLR